MKGICLNHYKVIIKFKVSVTFLTGYNSIFNVTDKIKFYFAKSITEKDGFIQITSPEAAYQLESLNIEINRNIIEEGHFTDVDYPFSRQPNFSTLGSIIEISRQHPLIISSSDDSIGDLLDFNSETKYEKYILSPNPVNILSFDNILRETYIAQEMILKVKNAE